VQRPNKPRYVESSDEEDDLPAVRGMDDNIELSQAPLTESAGSKRRRRPAVEEDDDDYAGEEAEEVSSPASGNSVQPLSVEARAEI
jgi:hypothetical protein